MAIDFKYKDVEAMPDGTIDVCLFNGAIRNSENEHMAKLLRAKSKILVAFGSCAHMGGIPGLANFSTQTRDLRRASTRRDAVDDNPSGVIPQTKVTGRPRASSTCPSSTTRCKTLAQTVPVDYFVPGCPPDAEQIWAVVHGRRGARTGKLPPKGAVLGAGEKTCCDECARVKEEKKVSDFHRPYEIIPEPEKCLLEQGIICMGPATRGGCGAPLRRRPTCPAAAATGRPKASSTRAPRC